MIWFIADTHFGHANILNFCKSRQTLFGKTIEAHDEALIKKWNAVIDKHDTVYILGDFAFYDADKLRKLIPRLNGDKILIIGNHDKVADWIKGYFNDIRSIKKMKFKKDNFPFMQDDMTVIMCHYPILSWEGKQKGSVHIHGHCHGNIDKINYETEELRVDVGLDGAFAFYNFVSLEKLYNHFKSKVNKKLFKEWAIEKYPSGIDTI